MSHDGPVIRPVTTEEFDGWAALFRGYRHFYRLAPDEAVVGRALIEEVTAIRRT